MFTMLHPIKSFLVICYYKIYKKKKHPLNNEPPISKEIFKDVRRTTKTGRM